MACATEYNKMFKVVMLFKAKPGISRTELMDYYERVHAPFVLSKLPQIRRYQRNFIDRNGMVVGPEAAPLPYDVITEMWFEDVDAYHEMMELYGSDIGQIINADGANFLSMATVQLFVVDERQSPER
jgi:uncharacterized protein (TIGR02118 family)